MKNKNWKNQLKPEGEQFSAEKFVLAGIAVMCLFFVASCGFVANKISGGRGDNSNTSDNQNASNTNSLMANTSSSFNSEKYTELINKAKEIENSKFSVKVDAKPTMKGKVYLLKNLQAGSSISYDEGIAQDRRARSLEELQTVVRVTCAKGKFLTTYSDPDPYGSKEVVKAYGINCQIALIDYPSKIITAQKEFSNNKVDEVISSRKAQLGEYVNQPPQGEMRSYINSFAVDKVLPEMTRLDEKEMVRLPFTEAVESDAALKGKIFIAQKYESGALASNMFSMIDKSDQYGFSYDKLTDKPNELGTLVTIICAHGNPIGKVEKTVELSNKCEVSLVDFKTLSVIAKKTIENKTLDESERVKANSLGQWVVDLPKKEIEEYLKSFPISN